MSRRRAGEGTALASALLLASRLRAMLVAVGIPSARDRRREELPTFDWQDDPHVRAHVRAMVISLAALAMSKE